MRRERSIREFAPGRKVRGFAYNGQVPGPLIEAEVGDEIEVNLRNNLFQATTIHWHGIRVPAERIRVPAEMDGTEAVQAPVEPGETFVYRFVVPDAGTHWYHAHTNEPTRTISLKALMHEGHHQRVDPVRVGELQVRELVNETGQDHPFHLHGFFFQVLQENGRAPTDLAWKDTVNVPRKTQSRIAWLPDDRTGEWMYHCHVLVHHAMGMMAHFAVVP